MIETELTNVLGHDISFEVENRVQEKIDNDAMLNGYKLIIGALCVLLAFIGIANVFSNTEPFFVGHFPEEPVMPGVLIVEAMAQCSGIDVYKRQAYGCPRPDPRGKPPGNRCP